MGMETLNNAARAAGFAMAGTDEIYEEPKSQVTPVAAGWQTPEAVLPQDTAMALRPQRTGDWLKSLLGLFGRRAPASPA